MDTFDLSQTIRKQAETRKTIDLASLQQYVISMTNTINLSASNGKINNRGYGWENGNYHLPSGSSTIAMVNTVLEGFMFALDCYAGYNSRAWRAFVQCPRWLDIVNTLHKIDDEQGTKHYWKLLDRLEHGHRGQCKNYGGNRDNPPTSREIDRATRIHNRYVCVLGL